MSETRDTLRPLGLGGGLTALLLSALWGGNVVSAKIALGTFAPFWTAFWRMSVGLAPVLLWAWKRHTSLWPQPREWRWLTYLGILMTVQISLVYLGVSFTSAGFASVLMNSHPIFTNFISHFFVPGDHLSWPRLIGLVTAFSGISATFLGRPEARLASRPLAGNLLCTATSALFAARTVFTSRIVARIDYVRTVFWQTVITIPFYLLAALALEPMTLQPVTWKALAALAYQGFMSNGVCTILWIRLLRNHRPGEVAIFGFPAPIFGVTFSAIIFAEKLSPALLVGVAAVAAGIFIVTRDRAQREIPSPPAQIRGAPS